MLYLFLLSVVESRRGRNLEMSGFRAGREAHAIATLISMPDQIAALTPSTVLWLVVYICKGATGLT
jgi:hypothetical protein